VSLPEHLDKNRVRAQLPLAYACYRLGVYLDEDGAALCPFHADRNPSFRLWVGDDGVERWHCYPCGTGGDVYDLIRLTHAVGFADAVVKAAEILADMPPGTEPPVRVRAPRLGPADWTHEVDEARARAAEPRYWGKLSDWLGLVDGSDKETCEEADSLLRDRLGWGVEETGASVMPHWTVDGTLTGCKVRAIDGRRWSKEGSRYEHLYACWLPKSFRDVLLLEGETDLAWALVTAYLEGTPVDLLALPSGAQRPPTEVQVDRLRGYRTVYLALDPDDAGAEASRTWSATLAQYDFADVRVCRLPRGKDVREARPRLADLLAEARAPLPAPQRISRSPIGYVITDASGNQRQITTWTADPVARLSGGDDGPGLEVDLQTRKSYTPGDVLRWSDLVSVHSLKRWAAARALLFSGSERDLQALAEYVQWRACFVPEVFQTDRVGVHSPPQAYRFAGPSVVYPRDHVGDLPWLYAPSAKKASVHDLVLLPTQGRFDWRWMDDFLDLSLPSVTHTILAWVCAASRRPEVRDFPLLFVGGASGCGKSTLSKLAMRLAGSRIEAPLGSVTPYILMQRLASSTSLPVFVDEWTRLSRADTRLMLQGLVPVIYEGGTAERGQSDLNVVRYRVTAPTIVAGEDTLHLDRELERVTAVFPRRAHQNPDALARIADAPLERFASSLHQALAEGRVRLPPLVDGHPPDRPSYNRAVLLGGWRTLLALADAYRNGGEYVPDLPDEPILPEPEETDFVDENVYELAVRESAGLRDRNGGLVVWADPSGEGTWVRFVPLLRVVEQALDVELPGRSRAMRDYFKGRYGVREGRARPELGIEYRAHLIEGFVL
jgi:hypothetical protein